MYSVEPILCGTMTGTKCVLTYRTGGNEAFEFPVYVFLLRPDDPADDVVLVDTGLQVEGTPYMEGRNKSVGPPGGGPDPVVDALADRGLEPGDVDTVVLTHLHHDHAANVALFDDAEFVVQRAEVAAMRDPLPIMAMSYLPETEADLSALSVRVVDGDERLCDGVDLLLTPGHSEGSQTVLAETDDGPRAMIADLAYCQHNLDPRRTTLTDADGRTLDVTPKEMDYIPPGTHVDVRDCYESIAKVRDRVGEDGVLLSSHDPEVPRLV